MRKRLLLMSVSVMIFSTSPWSILAMDGGKIEAKHQDKIEKLYEEGNTRAEERGWPTRQPGQSLQEWHNEINQHYQTLQEQIEDEAATYEEYDTRLNKVEREYEEILGAIKAEAGEHHERMMGAN